MIKIIDLKVLENWCIYCKFDDGCEKIISFKSSIHNSELTKPLSDKSYFKQVKVYKNGRGIYWPNEYDVCPDNMRYYMEDIKISQ